MPIYKKEKKYSDKLRSITIPQVNIPVIAPITLVGKLKKRLKAAFKFFDKKKEHSLTGRIQELNTHATDLWRSIEEIKGQFSEKGHYNIAEDPELGIVLEAIIDPLLREASQLYQGLHSISIGEQTKAFKKFGLWLERAKDWVQFFDRRRNKQEIIDAVVQHLVGEALTRIDRDIEIIKEYLHSQVINLAIDSDMQATLQHKIKSAVAPHVQNLSSLKKRPSKITLEGLGYWKNQIDHHRQTYFELALHAIDQEIEQESPSRYSEEANEHLQEVISTITHLEWETEELFEEVVNGELSDSVQKNILKAHLIALSEEAHELMLDLRLGWDLLTRLQVIVSKIEHAQKQLKIKKY